MDASKDGLSILLLASLWKKVRSDSSLRWDSVGIFSSWQLRWYSVEWCSRWHLKFVHLMKRRWILSKEFTSVLWCGFQTTDPYSTIGLMVVRKIILFVEMERSERQCRFRKPSMRKALFRTDDTWDLKDSLALMVTPRSLISLTRSRVILLAIYSVEMGECFRVRVKDLHLFTLSLSFQVSHQSESAVRSSWRRMQSYWMGDQ